MTVKTRITFFIAAAGFIASFLFSVFVFLELVEQPFALLDHVLKEEALRATERVLKKEGEPTTNLPGGGNPATHTYWIKIYEQDGNKMLYQSDLAQSVSLAPVPPGSSAVVSVTVPSGRIHTGLNEKHEVTFRVRTFPLVLDGQKFIVQIGRPIEKLKDEIWELVLGILSGLLFSTLALIVISRLVAGKILQPIGAMKDLARDISEKNLERRIPTGKGADEFSELARTINRMLDRLQYSFAKQRDLLFDTSHELKTPLTTMRLAIDELCADDGNKIPSLANENLLRLKNQVLRMERLVKDLLNLSSLETISGIKPEPVDLADLLSSLVEDYRFIADSHNISIDTRLPDRVMIQGDAEKLNRAFSNILDNALKYNVEGGRIEVTGEPSDIDFEVAVTNTGPGVPEADIPNVFDQFYRAEKSRSTQHGGSGLGLAIVKKIVELHNGEVKFESRPGHWTRVTVSLPADNLAHRSDK